MSRVEPVRMTARIRSVGGASFLGAFMAGLLLMPGCSKTDEHSSERPSGKNDRGKKCVVTVVNAPLLAFARRIGGPSIDVHFPVPPGVDPAFFVPDPEVIQIFQESDLILLNGAGYASWVDRVSLPQSRIVDTSRSFGDRLIEQAGGANHAHGPEGEHAHDGLAFTTWLDPSLAVEQARAIRDALATLQPEATSELETRFKDVSRVLTSLDLRMKRALEGLKGRNLIASHPVYQYFGRRYELDLRSLHWEPDRAPTDAEWALLEDWLAREPSRWMIWEAEPLAEVRSRLAELGLSILVIETGGGSVNEREGDYLDHLERTTARVEKALSSD